MSWQRLLEKRGGNGLGSSPTTVQSKLTPEGNGY